MNNYETLFVIKPTLTDEETAAQVAKITAVLEKEGAEILTIDNMGMRKLAYPVDKNERGVYTIIYYKAAGTVINELERNLKINEDVIKFLTVKYSKQKELTQFEKLVAASAKKSEALVQTETAPVVETETTEA